MPAELWGSGLAPEQASRGQQVAGQIDIVPVVRVGIAEGVVCPAPAVLITAGLGSCVGVTFWDPFTRIGGMVHVMLPDSRQGRGADNWAKYADLAIPEMVARLQRTGVPPRRLVVKMCGGAQMFNFGLQDPRFAIGERNVEAAIRALDALGLKVHARDTGGNYGRTMTLDLSSGAVTVRSIGHGVRVLV